MSSNDIAMVILAGMAFLAIVAMLRGATGGGVRGESLPGSGEIKPPRGGTGAVRPRPAQSPSAVMRPPLRIVMEDAPNVLRPGRMTNNEIDAAIKDLVAEKMRRSSIRPNEEKPRGA